MKYIKHNNHIFKQSTLREDEFFAVDDPTLFMILKETGKVWTIEDTGYSDFSAILYRDNIQNVLERDLSFINEELFTDPRDLISESNVESWAIHIKNNIVDGWFMRDIALVEQWYNDGSYKNIYFSVNLADTPLGENYEDSYDVDIYEFQAFRLYYRDSKGNYILIGEVLDGENYALDKPVAELN